MNISESFFIKLLADHLNGRKTEYVENIDWDAIFEFASIHKLEGMIFLQARTLLPRNRQAKFGINALLQFKDSQNKADALNKIELFFTEKDIPFLIVKGFEVAQYYPAVKERTMGDIDIVVKSIDKVRAANALSELGYINKGVGIYDWQYELGPVSIELHNHLQYENIDPHEQFLYTENVWNYALNLKGTSKFQLDWNFHLVFLLMHLQKHFENGGVGFRLFIDLVGVCKKVNIDLSQLKKDLEKLNLYKFASICFSLCERWFDVTMPFSVNLRDDFYINATEAVLKNGVFGLGKENMDYYVIARLNDKGRIGAILNRYFPSIKYLKTDPRFKYLEKWPILLPYAWLRRDLYAIAEGKLHEETTRFSKFFISDKKISERNDNLTKWGIDTK